MLTLVLEESDRKYGMNILWILPINRLVLENIVRISSLIRWRFPCKPSPIDRPSLMHWLINVELVERADRSCWRVFEACSWNWLEWRRRDFRNGRWALLSKLCLSFEQVHHIDVDSRLRFLFVRSYLCEIPGEEIDLLSKSISTRFILPVVERVIVDEVIPLLFDTKDEHIQMEEWNLMEIYHLFYLLFIMI